jgi:hypothetical protein
VPYLFGLVLAALLAGPSSHLEFNRDVRPILADHCASCHGPDVAQRKAGLRLDTRKAALLGGESGPAIVPGKPEESEALIRILSDDPDEQMPPPKSRKPLTLAQKETLRRWIAEGASYQPHWAYLTPKRPEVPRVSRVDWLRNPIDSFILDRLEREGLSPSPEADPATLVRRVTLDLTGLPPTLAEVDAYICNPSAEGYNRVVDRLLASPHFGERMAVDWLDAARFADTNGYQVDRDREMYAWRDWVIRAYNANKPFDAFTVEQIAGDLLPGATVDQRIATGFHRNHMMNEEGGVIPEEFLAEYTADRVETTAAVWLGQTFLCARCHDHKFDPFTQRDFYGLKAFFHNVPEPGVGNYGANIRRNNPPMIRLLSAAAEAKLAALNQELAGLKARLAKLTERKEKLSDKVKLEQKALETQAAAVSKKIDAADLEVPTALVMEEMAEPRPTFILVRGAYDKKGERVSPATPASLNPMAAGLPHNRLGLARWLVDPGNPLSARVTVNRLWQSFFGTGLVRTAEDFGTQGEAPSHPELLDWLATEFTASQWDVKRLVRTIVTSATYRQASRLTPLLRERDPDNRLLARGPRFRLQAEFVRDQALAASGLLVRAIGGPSVKPYHPPGLYEQVVTGSSADTYVQDKGTALYRRSLYTYWKRSVPNPAMLAFDAPFRETCTLRRPRTNTPLQALNLMNDPTYVEAARCLAERMLREGGKTADAQLAFGFRLVTARTPRPREKTILEGAFGRALAGFQADRTSAAALLSVGKSAADSSLDVSHLAALTTVASTLLNLDEVIMKD